VFGYKIWARRSPFTYDAAGSPKDVGNVTQPPDQKALSP